MQESKESRERVKTLVIGEKAVQAFVQGLEVAHTEGALGLEVRC